MTNKRNKNANFLNADWWNPATIEDVKAEIAKGADINGRDPEWTTPLMFAASHADLETVKLLAENKADINARDIHRQTPLMHAAVNNHDSKIIEFLK